ncbi:ribbon-helix-helix domain-containing protein [uncultured Victivallis sp.]|jgi:metal-responsive CopG/Arc/MetJ family transcriptional regulator|uniref:ribbon-helix-helix domain-containing protein n=1 Tax=uncultured Victivallis sp. TaxID=354118 RepID=UPI00259778A0|nr:ribbon-helix-helix domain-containing protein [uncultured Victivallis sp.]
MSKSQKQKIISVKLNKELYQQVLSLSEKTGTESVSAVVRQAIVFYLSKNTTKNN